MIIGEVHKGVYNSYDGSLKCTGGALCRFEGKVLSIEIKIFRKFSQRTNSQNRYFHGVVLPHFISAIKELWGEDWTLEQAKQYLKEKFGIIQSEHEGFIVYKSTADYTIEELMTFIEEIRDHASKDFNYYIPEANEYAESIN